MSTRGSRTGAARVAALAATAVLLTGCGVAGTDFQPGAAAQVNATDISLDTVDAYTTAFCEAIDSGSFGEVGPVARGELRQGVSGNLVRKAAAEQFAAEYGVEPGSYYEQVRTQVADQVAALPDEVGDALIEVQSADTFVNEVSSRVGEAALQREGTETPRPADSLERGLQIFAGWLEEQQVELNPVLGVTLDDAGAWAPADGSTSVAASTEAVLSTSSPVDAAGQPDPDYTAFVAALPASQRCGG